MDVNDIMRLKTAAVRASGDRAWFVDGESMRGDLNNGRYEICDKNGNKLFVIEGDIEHAGYVLALNNAFNRMLKETK